MRFHIVLLAALIAMMAPDSLRGQQRILRSGNPDGQLTASDVIADTGAPYNNVFRNQSIGGPRIRPRVGGGNAYINGLPEFRMEPLLRTPFIRRGFNPDDSLIKLGILYIDIDTARLSIFHTDNALRTQSNRKNETVGIFTFGIEALVQITEGFQISTRGNFVYLPFTNDVGIEGFGLVDSLNAWFGLDGGGQPFNAGISYGATVNDWDIRLFDDFQVEYVNGLFGIRGEFLDEIIVAQPRSFRPDENPDPINLTGIGAAGTRRHGRSSSRLSTSTSLTTDQLVLRNLAGGLASKQIVTQTRVTMLAYHLNQWYSAANTADTTEDTATITAVNERENMRFKTFASYTITKRSNVPGAEHFTAGGLFGPITDYIDFLGSAGWAKSGVTQTDQLIWRFTLDHTISPFTRHQFQYSRQVTEANPQRDLTTGYFYQFNQVLGPRLDGQFFARWEEFEDLDGTRPTQAEQTLGVRLLYAMSERTQMTFQASRPTSHSKWICSNGGYNHPTVWRSYSCGRFDTC